MKQLTPQQGICGGTYYKTLDNKQLPLLSNSKQGVFLLQKINNTDIMVISIFCLFPSSNLIITHINLHPALMKFSCQCVPSSSKTR